MSARRFWILAVALLGVALAIRVLVAVWWQDRLELAGQQFAMGDSDGYWHLAGDIAAQRPYEYGSSDAAVFRAPGYPWLLSWVVDPNAADPNVLTARLLGCVLGTGAVAIVMAVAGHWFDRSTALVAGLIAACYPGGITMSVLVLSEAPFIPLMMLTLAALSRRHAYGAAVSAGVLSGVAILVRPSWLLFLPFYYGLAVLCGPNRWLQIRLAICAGGATAAVMVPWWIRNYQVTGHFVPTTLQVGASLYDGLHPSATGASDTNMTFSGEFAQRIRDEAASSGQVVEDLEYRLNQRLAQAAILWAGQHPGRGLELAGRKIARTWWPWPSAGELPGGAAARWTFALGSLAILIPGVTYGLRGRVWRSNLWPYVVPLIYFTLLHAVFVGSVRYRQPALFALVVLAAPQYVAWWRWIFRGSAEEPASAPSLNR